MRPIVSTSTIIGLVVAFLLGTMFGLMVFGWWLFPVEWVNAGPNDLSDFYQVQYVQTVADSFAGTGAGNTDKARKAMEGLGDEANTALQLTLNNSSGADNLSVSLLASQLGITPQATALEEGGLMGLLRSALPICAVGLLLLVAVGGAVFFLRMRSGSSAPVPTKTRTATSYSTTASSTQIPASEMTYQPGEEPVSTFKTTYMLGNDLFDESFSVDDQQGDFLGECGVGIGETIGVGDPKKVTAFEVWLFDKNDIRTVTRVVMSEHAFRDETLKAKLSAKGEPALAKPGEVIKMETATLKVEARVVDMQYGSGPLPPSSFFQQITLEIAAWKKVA